VSCAATKPAASGRAAPRAVKMALVTKF